MSVRRITISMLNSANRAVRIRQLPSACLRVGEFAEEQGLKRTYNSELQILIPCSVTIHVHVIEGDPTTLQTSDLITMSNLQVTKGHIRVTEE